MIFGEVLVRIPSFCEHALTNWTNDPNHPSEQCCRRIILEEDLQEVEYQLGKRELRIYIAREKMKHFNRTDYINSTTAFTQKNNNYNPTTARKAQLEGKPMSLMYHIFHIEKILQQVYLRMILQSMSKFI